MNRIKKAFFILILIIFSINGSILNIQSNSRLFAQSRIKQETLSLASIFYNDANVIEVLNSEIVKFLFNMYQEGDIENIISYLKEIAVETGQEDKFRIVRTGIIAKTKESLDITKLGKEEYELFIHNIYRGWISSEDLEKIDGVKTNYIRFGIEIRKHVKGFRYEFWVNRTLEEDINNNLELFNLWTFKRAARLYPLIEFWKGAKENPKAAVKGTRLSKKYELDQENAKAVIGIGDPHGDLHQMIFPLAQEGIVRVTGNLVFYDTKNHRRAEPHEITPRTLKNYILLPELEFNRDKKEIFQEFIIQYLGDIIDRGEWTDECWFLLEDLFNLTQEEELISSLIGNHELGAVEAKCDLLSGYILGRRDAIQSGFDKFLGLKKLEYLRVLKGITAGHSYIENTFLEILLENLDADSLGTEKKGETGRRKSLDLLGFLGNRDEYKGIKATLQNLLKTCGDEDINISPKDKRLVVAFLRDLFNKSFRLRNQDRRAMQILMAFFWIDNGANPDNLTGMRNPLWSWKEHIKPDDVEGGKIVNIDSMFGHLGLLPEEKYSEYMLEEKGKLKLCMDIDGSYATNWKWQPAPKYFKIHPDGTVDVIEFREPEALFINELQEFPFDAIKTTSYLDAARFFLCSVTKSIPTFTDASTLVDRFIHHYDPKNDWLNIADYQAMITAD